MIKAWIEAMRLRTLPVSVAGVFAGTWCAGFYGSIRWMPALICLIFAVVAQIASNFANEYFDYANGLDRKGREGFRRGVTEGDIAPHLMLRATILLIILDCVLGCTLFLFGSWWILFVGIAVAIFALAYSTGPYPLSHHGLGDIAVVIFFGMVPVIFTCYLQTGIWDWHSVSIPVSVAVGLMAANVLIVNNYRDMEDDKAVGKHTTVVLFGRGVMGTAYLLSGIAATLLTIIPLASSAGWWLAIPCTAYLPLHLILWRKITTNGAALNPRLGKTAMALLLFVILLSVIIL
jgi:1,4-dihydroxy-2-naphthoate octaprenyltransferase